MTITEQPPTGLTAVERIRVSTGTAMDMWVECGFTNQRTWCRRDRGPWFNVDVSQQQIAFTAETFAVRQLATVAPGSVLALEILPGRGSVQPRQHIRQDLGVWRSEAGDATVVVDVERVDTLLAALRSARALEWVGRPPGDWLRELRAETTPGAEDLRWRIYDNCVVEIVGAQRFATVAHGVCQDLRTDLLRDGSR